MRKAVGLLFILALALPVSGQTPIPPKVLSQLKGSTVYVKVRVGSLVASGSGFLLDRQGPTGVVVTNAHVIRGRAGSSGLEVVLFSGTSAERTLKADVFAEDADRDLALLLINSDKLPLPIARTRTIPLRETLPVHVIGFPFGEALAAKKGNPEVTLSAGSISSLRKDDYGNLVAIQLDGGINPGNSGGPVVDAAGDLLGIAVAKVTGSQIGLVIPAQSLRDMLMGRVDHAAVRMLSNQKGVVELAFDLHLIDPMQSLQRVSVLLLPQEQLKEEPKPRPDGQFNGLKNAHEQALALEGQTAKGVVTLRIKGDKADYLHQVKMVRRDRKVFFTEPTALSIGPGRVVAVTTTSEKKPSPEKVTPESPVQPEVTTPPRPAEPAPKAEEAVTKLPGTIEDLAVAGGGRYVVCKVKDIPALTVYDSYAAKLARHLRLPSTEFVFGAGGTTAVIYFKDESLLQSWNLETGEKLKTKPNPFSSPVLCIVMGHSRGDQAFVRYGAERSGGPSEAGMSLLDTASLQPIETTGSDGQRYLAYGDYGMQMRANHDLSRIAFWSLGSSPAGINLLRRVGNSYNHKRQHDTAGALLPGDDGRLYTGVGRILSDDLLGVGELQGHFLWPGLGGNLVLGMDQKGQLQIHEPGKTSPLTPWGQFPEWTQKAGEVMSKTQLEPGLLRADKRVIFAPNIGRLMFIPIEADRIILKPFDLKTTLDRSGIDYLIVTSSPPTEVRLRQQWQYQVEVLSKAGSLKYSLELAPPTMKITDAGLITWAVPPSLPEQGEKVVVLVADRSGEQAYHTFTIRASSRPPASLGGIGAMGPKTRPARQ
jgi:hypothetical protein